MAGGDALTRDDLISGLGDVVQVLRDDGAAASILIVGGAALSLRYFDRRTTADIDARLQPSEPVLKAAREVAARRGWSDAWLNMNAAQFIPTYARQPTWQVLYDDGLITISVASPDALLAMKLRAGRKGRDEDDIASLLSICSIASLAAAESLYESFYPGEDIPERTQEIFAVILGVGIPDAPVPPDPPSIANR